MNNCVTLITCCSRHKTHRHNQTHHSRHQHNKKWSETNRDFVQSWRNINRQSQVFIWALWRSWNCCQHTFTADIYGQ